MKGARTGDDHEKAAGAAQMFNRQESMYRQVASIRSKQEEEVEVEVPLDAGEQGFAESFRELVEAPEEPEDEEVLALGDSAKIGGPGHVWACLGLVEVLFELAEAEDYGTVREMLNAPLRSTPNALLLAICLAEDRSRGALRADLLERVAPPLFEANAGPQALLVSSALAERAPKELKRLLRSMQEKDPKINLPKVVSLLQKAPRLVEFYNGLLQGPPSELSCRMALLQGPQAAKLGAWLKKVLVDHKDGAALALVRFLRPSLLPNGPVLGGDEASICRSWLEALLEAAALLSPDSARQVTELAQLAYQKFPVPGPVAATSVGLLVTDEKQPMAPPPGPPPPPSSAPLSAEELEESSNGYFKAIYTGSMRAVGALQSANKPSKGTDWSSRELPVQIFGVIRHTARADEMGATWKGASWFQSEDFKRYPYDPPLSDEGLEEAGQVAERVSNFLGALPDSAKIHVVVSSPYLRCIQTAAAVCRRLGSSSVRLIVDLGLGEVYGPEIFGDLEPERSTTSRVASSWEGKGREWSEHFPQEVSSIECINTPMGK
ncbi:unnamed protein product, partial [Polarella glacialis]